MLGFSGQYAKMERSVGKERCKRNYEKEIENLKERKRLTKNLHDSLFEYAREFSEFGSAEETVMMMALLGSSEVQWAQIDKVVDTLMKEWEESKD